jgi:predicted PurR-regulated permease PerM
VKALPDTADRVREMMSSQLGISPEVVQEATSSRGSGETGSTETAGEISSPLLPGAASAMFALAGHLVVIFFLVFFLVLSGHHVRKRLVEISGPDTDRRRMVATIISDINAQIQRYLLVLLVTGAIVGVATWIVLAWLDVRHAAMWALLAGIFNSIPYFGPVVVSGGLFLVGIVQGGGMTQALQMSGAALVITSLEGWLLTPTLMGKAERMSPLAVFLGLLLWTWVWGAWGTLLAVPMLVIIKSIADHVDRFRPVGRLMAP